ncbi:hypothetical protein GGF50DRAFT_51159 [Schizophyllum commune]
MIGATLGTFIPAFCRRANQLASVIVAPKNSRCIQAAAEPGAQNMEMHSPLTGPKGPKPTISSRRERSHSSGMTVATTMNTATSKSTGCCSWRNESALIHNSPTKTTMSTIALPICARISFDCASSAPRSTRMPTIASVAFATIAFTACRRASCVDASSSGVESSAIAVSNTDCKARPTACEATSRTLDDASSLSKASSPTASKCSSLFTINRSCAASSTVTCTAPTRRSIVSRESANFASISLIALAAAFAASSTVCAKLSNSLPTASVAGLTVWPKSCQKVVALSRDAVTIRTSNDSV